MQFNKALSIGGLVFTLAGAGLGTYGTWVSPREAVEIGVMRLSGDTVDQNLKLPMVQNLLHQANYSAYGFILIGVGTLLQIGAAFRGKDTDRGSLNLMARTLKDTGSQCWEVYDGDRLVARIVPHNSGSGWKGVDLTGKNLTLQPYDTPQLVEKSLPLNL